MSICKDLPRSKALSGGSADSAMPADFTDSAFDTKSHRYPISFPTLAQVFDLDWHLHSSSSSTFQRTGLANYSMYDKSGSILHIKKQF